MKVSVSSCFPEKVKGTAIFGSLWGGRNAWYHGERGQDASKGTWVEEGCWGIGSTGVIEQAGTGNTRLPGCICMLLMVAVRNDTWLTSAPIAWIVWMSCLSDVDIVIGDSVEMLSENCSEMEHRWKMLNTSSLGQVHDPVLSLSQGKSVKENPKNDLLSQVVR